MAIQVFGNRFSTARSAVNTRAVQRIKLRSDCPSGNTTNVHKVHLRSKLLGAIIAKGQAPRETPPECTSCFETVLLIVHIACGRLGLTGSTPVIELVAVRILELIRDGEFDPDRLTEARCRRSRGSGVGGGRSCAASRARTGGLATRHGATWRCCLGYPTEAAGILLPRLEVRWSSLHSGWGTTVSGCCGV